MATVKYTGPVASFHCPTNAEIRSLKVHFSPKQEGSGDPSPENVRPIVGWDGVVVHNDDGNIVPEEYQKVEYLKNDSGKPYINTNIIPTPNMRIYIEGKTSSNVSGPGFIFGSRKDDGTTIGSEMFWAITWNSYYCYGLGTARNTRIISANINSDFTLDFNCNYAHAVKINNILSVNNDASASFSQPIYLFGINTDGNLDGQYVNGLIIKRFIVYEAYNIDTIKANLIPCRRKSDDKPGMYDTISQTFFTNQGTGEFICGPDVGKMVEYKFGVLGKNKFNPENEIEKAYVDVYGETIPYSYNYWKASDYIPVSGNAVYTFNPGSNSGSLAKHCYYDENKNFISYIDSGIQTFTTPNNAKYMRFSYRGTDTPQLELGSTATTYEPYNPNHTVYGGWVDLITGEVCEEYNKITIDGENRKATYVYKGDGAYGAGYVYVSPGGQSARYKNGVPLNIWVENLPLYIGVNTLPNIPYVYAPLAGALYTVFYLASVEEHPELEDASARREYVNNWLKQNPVTIVYELSTPNTYHIAPTQLQTFLGQNNVWSNADYVEVEYDLHETQTLLQRKAFIIANQPHIESASGTIASFNTDLRAPLKECKAYFSPIQEGSGDPSPDNVRPITGWTGMTLYHASKNIFSSTIEQGSFNSSTGAEVTSSTRVRSKYVPISAGTFTVSNSSGLDTVVYAYDTNQSFLSNESIVSWQGSTYTFTVTKAKYVRFAWKNSAGSTITPSSISGIQLECGSAATTYEPYNGTTLLIDWSSAGTVYGGYVDLVTGEVWKTWDIIDLGTCTWIQYNNNSSIFYTRNLNNLKEQSNQYTVLCTAYPYEQQKNVTAMNDKTINDSEQLNRGNVAIRDINYANSTSADFKEAMNGVICAYKLATPILVTTLTSQSLKTLRGTNNIWSSADGDTQVKFYKH